MHRTEHRQIFASLTALINTSRPADVITVFERLQAAGQADDCGGLVYLNDLAQGVPSGAAVKAYADIITQHSMRRRLLAVGNDVVAAGFSGGTAEADLPTLIERAAHKWRAEEGDYRDDITALCIRLPDLFKLG